ncbi:MAG: hypothetical protein AAF358_02940 [Pseudomonadota bacterium]
MDLCIHVAAKTRLATLLVIALLIGSTSIAQTPLPEADLSFEIELNPPEPIAAGTVGEYTITMFNAGPEPATPGVRTSAVPEGLVFVGLRDDTCFFVVTDFSRPPPLPPFFVYGVSTINLLPAGESIQCSGNYFLSADFEGSLEITWTIGNISGGLTGPMTDPNDSNNTQRTVFGIPLPTAVPAIGPVAVTTVVLLIITFTANFLRRR